MLPIEKLVKLMTSDAPIGTSRNRPRIAVKGAENPQPARLRRVERVVIAEPPAESLKPAIGVAAAVSPGSSCSPDRVHRLLELLSRLLARVLGADDLVELVVERGADLLPLRERRRRLRVLQLLAEDLHVGVVLERR